MKTILCLCCALISATALHGADTETGPKEVLLSQSDAVPELNLALTVPEGWSLSWSQGGRSASVARLVRDESKGVDSIVIAASPLRSSDRDKADVFDAGFIRAMTDNLKARRGQRVRNDFWDGAYFQYELALPVAGGQVKVDVRNWMLSADGYIVQFQCYFPKNFGLEADVRAEKEEATVQLYRDILTSVRRVAPEERPAPAPKTKQNPKGR